MFWFALSCGEIMTVYFGEIASDPSRQASNRSAYTTPRQYPGIINVAPCFSHQNIERAFVDNNFPGDARNIPDQM
jgi:hypothetical protein